MSETLLERAYQPPALFIAEEVEIGGGYHTLSVTRGPERDWSEPYKKTGIAQYRSRVVAVPYPPSSSAVLERAAMEMGRVRGGMAHTAAQQALLTAALDFYDANRREGDPPTGGSVECS